MSMPPVRLAFALLLAATRPADAADWPQWRGPDRTNVSKETGLLDEWPKDGPLLVWKSEEVGQGVPSVAVAEKNGWVNTPM